MDNFFFLIYLLVVVVAGIALMNFGYNLWERSNIDWYFPFSIDLAIYHETDIYAKMKKKRNSYEITAMEGLQLIKFYP